MLSAFLGVTRELLAEAPLMYPYGGTPVSRLAGIVALET